MGSVDRNRITRKEIFPKWKSLPSWGAWIEMVWIANSFAHNPVAPLVGSVDRNEDILTAAVAVAAVAPLVGSVDRNVPAAGASMGRLVAPLVGSVDRNRAVFGALADANESLPSWGAWIEMA